MKRFLKRHRYTCVLVFIFILLVILGLKVKQILIPDEGKATYGDRLKNIEKHPINNDLYDKIDAALTKNSSVKEVSHRVQGKTLNYYITFTDKTSVKDAKAIGDGVLDQFDEDTLSYYSIQFYLVKEDESLNNFPIIGMKHPESSKISWTKDREIVTESENDEE